MTFSKITFQKQKQKLLQFIFLERFSAFNLTKKYYVIHHAKRGGDDDNTIGICSNGNDNKTAQKNFGAVKGSGYQSALMLTLQMLHHSRLTYLLLIENLQVLGVMVASSRHLL